MKFIEIKTSETDHKQILFFLGCLSNHLGYLSVYVNFLKETKF